MSFASFLADSAAVRDRGEWWVELYLKNPAGAQEILRFSRRGTPTGPTAVTVGSDTIPAHAAFRKRILKAPWLQQSLWSAGRILTRSIPSFGELVLNNTDGKLDPYRPADPPTIAASGAGYTWGGCRCKGFFLDAADPQGTIGKVYDGKIGTPTFGLPAPLSVPLSDRSSDFEVPTSSRVFRGTGYQLELTGDRTVSYGTPAAVDLTGSLTLEFWHWIDVMSSTSSNLDFWGWVGGTASPFLLRLRLSGNLRLAAHIGGALETVVPTTINLSALVPYHIAIVISGRNVTFYLWNEDTQTLVTEVIPNAFSSATRDTHVGGTYLLRSGSDGTYKAWFDEMRVWSGARTLAEIEADRYREIPAGSIPAAVKHYTRMNDGSGTSVTDSSATAANGTISGAGTSTWIPSAEGGPELSGTPRLDVFGRTYRNTLILVDGVRQIYQVAGGGPVKSIVTDEGGVVHTQDAATATLRAFLTTTPTLASSVHLPKALVRLKNVPTLPVSATVEGYNAGALGYTSAAGTITRRLATERGPLLVDPTDLDTASFAAFATAAPAEIGLFLPRPIPLSAALDFVNIGGAGWWGFARASTLLHVERFTGPAVTPVTTFDARHVIDLVEFPPLAVVWKVIVRYRHNSVVLTDDQIAASVTTGRQALTMEWQEAEKHDDAIRAANPGDASVPVTVETCLYNETDANALAVALLALLKGVKSGFRMTVRAAGLQLSIGQTIAINFVYQDGRRRLGLDGTKMFSIVSIEDARQRGEVKLEVWG